jgi:predicted ester cyclase
MESEAEAVARGAIEAINDRTLRARAQELLDPSIVRHDLVQLFPDSHGASSGSDLVGTILAALPDFRLDVQDIIGADDKVALRLRMTGTHTGEPLLGRSATGAKLSAYGVFIYRVQSGRVAEAWQMFDGLAFLRLAGLLR